MRIRVHKRAHIVRLMVNIRKHHHPRRKIIKNRFFGFFGSGIGFGGSRHGTFDPRSMGFLSAFWSKFFFIIICFFFIDFSLLSSPGYSLSSPGGPPDRKKKKDFSQKDYIFQYFAYKPPFNPI